MDILIWTGTPEELNLALSRIWGQGLGPEAATLRNAELEFGSYGTRKAMINETYRGTQSLNLLVFDLDRGTVVRDWVDTDELVRASLKE